MSSQDRAGPGGRGLSCESSKREIPSPVTGMQGLSMEQLIRDLEGGYRSVCRRTAGAGFPVKLHRTGYYQSWHKLFSSRSRSNPHLTMGRKLSIIRECACIG